MLPLTRLPVNLRYFLRGTQHFFRHRHHLMFCWSVTLLLIYQDKATLCGLARLGPNHIAEWHLRRLLYATYWSWRLLLGHLVDAVIAGLPAAKDGRVLVLVDGTYKAKVAKKHPLVRKARADGYSPFLWGFEVILVMLQWGNYRIPIDFELVRRKEDPAYQKPNALFRQMLAALVPPAWAQQVIVIADAGFPAKETLHLIQQRGFFFVMSLPRTWKFEDGHTLKDWVNHTRHSCYRKSWFRPHGSRRRVYWVYRGRKRLRHIGDGTLVLSKKRRNDSPKQTKILVTNLPDVTTGQLVVLYTCRWHVELLIKELKGATGLGQAQVTKQTQRVERSVALSVMAYLVLIQLRQRDIPHQGPWSAFTRKRNFACQSARKQIEHNQKRTYTKAA